VLRLDPTPVSVSQQLLNRSSTFTHRNPNNSGSSWGDPRVERLIWVLVESQGCSIIIVIFIPPYTPNSVDVSVMHPEDPISSSCKYVGHCAAYPIAYLVHSTSKAAWCAISVFYTTILEYAMVHGLHHVWPLDSSFSLSILLKYLKQILAHALRRFPTYVISFAPSIDMRL
jgi:hypothetical protein